MIKRANECHCGGDTRVKWTRTNEHTGKVQRRRECRVCGHRWTTSEVVDESKPADSSTTTGSVAT